MKAEERKHLKENDLAERLGRFWQTIASGSTTNNIIWGVIVVGLALAIGWRYYSDATFRTRSAQWSAIERADTEAELKQVIEQHPGSVAARIAKYHLSRYQMDDALARVASPTSDDRTKAADTLVEVRNRYAELANESGVEPELTQEALMGVAKATEVLAGIPKADNPNEPRASLDEAQKAYQELANRYPDSYLGKEAAKRARLIADHTTQVRAFYDGLMEAHGKPATPPTLPPAPPALPPTSPPGPALPPAPSAPPTTPALAPADKGAPPVPPAATPNPPPAGVNPAEPPKAPKEEPKPKAP